MKQILFVCLFILPVTAAAVTGRMIQLSGTLVKIGKEKSLIKDEKGNMYIPTSSVDKRHASVGQWITVTVDFVDFYRMNPEKFKKAN